MINVFQIALGVYIVSMIASVATIGPEASALMDLPLIERFSAP